MALNKILFEIKTNKIKTSVHLKQDQKKSVPRCKPNLDCYNTSVIYIFLNTHFNRCIFVLA